VSEYTISLVPPAAIDVVWSLAYPHVEKAAEYTFGRYEPEDILEFVRSGHAHLWVALKDETITGVTITRFWQYPRKKCLDMVFIGGDEGFSWKDPMLAMLQRWARDSGCEVIESSGRPGFARAFKDDGYKLLWQVYELPVVTEGVGG
jgi:hypothetical protein